MEFNTDSIWSIISLLFLVTILIIVWYFYNELVMVKSRIIEIEDNFSKYFNELQSDHELYDEDIEDDPEEYDEDVEEDIEDPDQPEEEFESEHPLQMQSMENKQCSENCGEVCNENCLEGCAENCDERCPEDCQEEKIEEPEEITGCNHIMINGKRKGQLCGKNIKEGGKCSAHC